MKVVPARLSFFQPGPHLKESLGTRLVENLVNVHFLTGLEKGNGFGVAFPDPFMFAKGYSYQYI